MRSTLTISVCMYGFVYVCAYIYIYIYISRDLISSGRAKKKISKEANLNITRLLKNIYSKQIFNFIN